MILRSAALWCSTSRCTLVTRGQVASMCGKRRRSASDLTDFATPCAENTTGAPSGTSSSFLYKDRSLGGKTGDDPRVVHDLMPNENRRAKPVEALFDGFNRAFHPSAKSAWAGQ